METYQCSYQDCKQRAEFRCNCTPQAAFFCFIHISNHMSKNQSTHNVEKIYNEPLERTKAFVVDVLSQKLKELEKLKKEIINKYSEVFIQSQNSIKKGLGIMDSGINYCQAEIAKIAQTTEISIFESDNILLSLLQEPEIALKIVQNITSQIEINDQISFLAVLDGDLVHPTTENNSKVLNTFYIEKIDNLENENKKLIKRVQALERENICQNAINPLLIQEQFDIQNKSVMDSEIKLTKMSKEIDFLKNKFNEMQEMIEKIQKEKINQLNEIQNPLQVIEESKEVEVELEANEIHNIPNPPEENKSNIVSIDEQVERLANMFGFSTKIAMWMLIQIGNYETAEDALVTLMEEQSLNLQAGKDETSLENIIAESIAEKIPVEVIKSIAENTLDFDNWVINTSQNNIQRVYTLATKKELNLKAFKKAYEIVSSQNK